MNVKTKRTKKQVNVENQAINLLSKEELNKKIEAVEKELRSCTWRELETNGKFSKNDKLSFITDDMLIVGCDIGSDTHYIRAIDVRGRELSRGAFEFSNTSEGFENAKAWMLELAAKNDKKQIVLGLEPTGHYWFALAAWMISRGISVVQVNPYVVKQSKEIEDNSQLKDDRKDPKLIANLVKDGNYGMPYLPENVYADMRRLSMFRDQLTEDRIRNINRLHRELKIYFPEYMDAFGKIDGAFTLEVLKVTAIPSEIKELGVEGLKNIWHNAKLRGRGYSRAGEIVSYAEKNVGLMDGTDVGREAVRWYAEQILKLDGQLATVESILHRKCREIQKLSGMGLVACSSGKHKGQTKISHRGRKRLRYWLFQAAKSAVSHADEFKQMHEYYTTRPNNPLKKMQSLIVIACKILRVIYTILKTGTTYDPKKLLKDIKRPVEAQVPMAA